MSSRSSPRTGLFVVWEQIVDNPVPQCRGGGGARGGLQGSRARQNSAAFEEQIVDIPARRGLQIFSRAADEGIQGVFRTSPCRKKCEVGSALRVGTECGLYSVHAGSLCGLRWAADVGRGADFDPWTPAAYAESMAGADDEFKAEVGGGGGGGGGGGRSDSLANAGLHAVPRAPAGSASVGVCLWR